MSAKDVRVSRKHSKLMVVTPATKNVPLPKVEKKQPGIITQFINIVDVLREEADREQPSETA